jgi:CheY-like chemotaxis protein
MTILKSKTIFVIEDDPGISFVLSELLESEGFKVQVAENGVVALELLQKHGVPSLILLDMIMPKMNGWEFAKEFTEKYDHLCPIIAMTAAADAQQRAKDINAVDLIEKPFDFDKLLATIKKHITV